MKVTAGHWVQFNPPFHWLTRTPRNFSAAQTNSPLREGKGKKNSVCYLFTFKFSYLWWGTIKRWQWTFWFILIINMICSRFTVSTLAPSSPWLHVLPLVGNVSLRQSGRWRTIICWKTHLQGSDITSPVVSRRSELSPNVSRGPHSSNCLSGKHVDISASHAFFMQRPPHPHPPIAQEPRCLFIHRVTHRSVRGWKTMAHVGRGVWADNGRMRKRSWWRWCGSTRPMALLECATHTEEDRNVMFQTIYRT